jgi:predicted CXXCH cytochrome family protein
VRCGNGLKNAGSAGAGALDAARQQVAGRGVRAAGILLILFSLFLAGCDPVARHEALSTIFDGVPTLPPTEDLCKEYHEKRVAEEKAHIAAKKLPADDDEKTVLSHAPYDEKRCNDCHSADKSTETGLIAPPRELCFVCHTDFIKGTFVHGPVAVGDCLACHVPHTSTFSPLLVLSRGEICGKCHREKRLASDMHNKVAARQMICIDCHDPHFGNARYFLK